MKNTSASQDVVVIERDFDAPVALIWQMWTDPDHFKTWYGPAGVTIPIAEMDVRVGGRRRVCMEVPSASGPNRMWFTGEYREVIANERLVYTESISDEDGNVATTTDGHPATTQVRVDLAGDGGRTKIVLTHSGIPGESPGAMGWAMALDKLSLCVAERVDGGAGTINGDGASDS